MLEFQSGVICRLNNTFQREKKSRVGLKGMSRKFLVGVPPPPEFCDLRPLAWTRSQYPGPTCRSCTRWWAKQGSNL